MTRLQKTLAVSLRKYDFSETSQVLHLYTRDYGKVHCIAKGAKRKKSAFHGPFDVMVLYEVIRLEKQPGALDLLTAAEALRDYREVRADFARFSAASYACDLVDEFTLEGQPQPELFELLRRMLEALAGGSPVTPSVFSFEARLLRILGHAPRIAECGVCRRRVIGPETYFSARDGGAVCVRCRPRDPTRLLVPRAVLDAMGAFVEGRPADLRALPNLVDHLRRVMDTYLRHLLEREPKTMRFMREAVLAPRP
ncbi:MAG: DNA repair protein RecO [Planctomycetes bacterium]|nr:DNA repair protein RecO [Planctomycetota bacterium]